jgi:hypothetical protein
MRCEVADQIGDFFEGVAARLPEQERKDPHEHPVDGPVLIGVH